MHGVIASKLLRLGSLAGALGALPRTVVSVALLAWCRGSEQGH
jgi:hypothetical protein